MPAPNRPTSSGQWRSIQSRPTDHLYRHRRARWLPGDDDQQAGLELRLGPAPLVVHVGAEVVALHALGAQPDDLVILAQRAQRQPAELVVVAELEPAVLGAPDRAEHVGDVSAI